MNAKDLRPGDDFTLKLTCTVLSAEPISKTYVRVCVTIEDQPSLSLDAVNMLSQHDIATIGSISPHILLTSLACPARCYREHLSRRC